MVVNPDTQRLLDLYALDQELKRLQEAREELPARISGIRDELRTLREEKERREEEVKGLKLGRMELEERIEGLRARRQKYEDQRKEVRNNRQYAALLTEIERTKEEISTLEDQVLEGMEEAESIEATLAELTARLEERQATAAEELRELQEQVETLQSDIAVMEDRRANLVIRVDEEWLREYERVLQAHSGGQVLVPLHQGVCGACYGFIPLQQVAEMRAGKGILCCEHCGALIYDAQEDYG